MVVTLDHERVKIAAGPEESLRALIDRVRGEHAPGRIMVAVSVDGRTLAGDELDAALARPIAAASQVDLESDHAGALVVAALCDLAERLELAGAAHQEVAARFSSGEVVRATRDLGDLLAVWSDGHAVLSDATRLLGWDLGELDACGGSVKGHLEALASKLRDVRDAVESRDYVHVADLLEYELAGVCGEWERICRELAGRVERGAAAATG